MDKFKEFYKAKLSSREIANIKNSIEQWQEEGLSPKRMIRRLQDNRKKLKDQWKAERAFRTEANRINTEDVKAGAKKFGYNFFKTIIEPTACPLCKSFEGKVFSYKQLEKNEKLAPPHHPNCRCSLVIISKK